MISKGSLVSYAAYHSTDGMPADSKKIYIAISNPYIRSIGYPKFRTPPTQVVDIIKINGAPAGRIYTLPVCRLKVISE